MTYGATFRLTQLAVRIRYESLKKLGSIAILGYDAHILGFLGWVQHWFSTNISLDCIQAKIEQSERESRTRNQNSMLTPPMLKC